MATRNSESRFAEIPRANIRRARFKRNFSNITTFNEGDLIPLYVDEVLPGDTISIKLNGLVRMSTPLYPVMDNAYMDTYCFFVPNRLLWEHWENLQGQNDQGYWADKTEYTTPVCAAPAGGWNVGTIADYMGIPTGVAGLKVNSLPFRAYARIWNEWFRDENLQAPVTQDTDDKEQTGVNTGKAPTDAQNGGLPLKVAKFHDYFTSCLPEPQKGQAIGFDLTGGTKGLIGVQFPTEAEVIASSERFTATGPSGNDYMIVEAASANTKGLVKTGKEGFYALGGENQKFMIGASNRGPANWQTAEGVKAGIIKATSSSLDTNFLSINDLRQAIALQQILEADARGGTRYTEILKNHFGVTSPDARLQRSEYVGGARTPINVNQVVQTSGSTSTSPQGNTGAYSMTTFGDKVCTYSATEHGFIMVLAAVRVDHSYQQGLARMWTRSDRFSYYMPLMANLGEMPVYNQEIFAQGNAQDKEVFGYQEAWADYRYHPNIVTGQMRSQYAQSLDAWHYADDYEKLPMLSSSWIQEDSKPIERTLAVEVQNGPQFIGDFYFDQTWTRPMPIYSVPGLERI
ncbi:VP1 [Gokushovirus WZ-2015a]|nr:VP1 [Gokushovirus WZ-2015a]